MRPRTFETCDPDRAWGIEEGEGRGIKHARLDEGGLDNVRNDAAAAAAVLTRFSQRSENERVICFAFRFIANGYIFRSVCIE